MTSLIQNFLAARAAKSERQPVANAEQSVTRAEFNTLLQAVHGLIEDFDTIASPEKLQAAFNSAIKDAMPLVNAKHPAVRFVAPEGKDGAATIANKRAGKFTAPAGE